MLYVVRRLNKPLYIIYSSFSGFKPSFVLYEKKQSVCNWRTKGNPQSTTGEGFLLPSQRGLRRFHLPYALLGGRNNIGTDKCTRKSGKGYALSDLDFYLSVSTVNK